MRPQTAPYRFLGPPGCRRTAACADRSGARLRRVRRPPPDRGNSDPRNAFLFGDIFEKGIGIKAGQTHVQKYMPELLAAIEEGKLRPQEIISHRLKLDQAAEGYKMFDKKEDECRKVILTP